MILQTGGRSVGATSTRSRLASRARSIAWAVGMMPYCSPAAPITRMGLMRIWSLMRGPMSRGGCRPNRSGGGIVGLLESRQWPASRRSEPPGLINPIVITPFGRPVNGLVHAGSHFLRPHLSEFDEYPDGRLHLLQARPFQGRMQVVFARREVRRRQPEFREPGAVGAAANDADARRQP